MSKISKLIHSLLVLLMAVATLGCHRKERESQPPPAPTEVHVRPGDDIQAALDQVAASPTLTKVVVHAGTYAPPEHRQALIWFNGKHDGIEVLAQGEVTLTAANPTIANKNHKAYPAVVNHVVYFGDGISEKTKLDGFTITGANNYVTTKKGPPIEPNSEQPRLAKTAFFYTDGGAIKVFGRSYPTLENLHIVDNYASPSGAGISIEHRGYTDQAVTIRNCEFRDNRSPLTGSALCLLDHEFGSRARIENCLFVNNLSNCKLDRRSQSLGTWRPKMGHGAVTLFAFSHADFSRCTFTGNRNGVDDLSSNSTYRDCVFWDNTASGGWIEGDHYEIMVSNMDAEISNCLIYGTSLQIDPRKNMLEAPDPEFDDVFRPRNPLYGDVGYRLVDSPNVPAPKRQTVVAATAKEPLQILIEGEQFNWNIRYPGKDGELKTEDDPVVRRHLYVPSARKIRLIVESQDYLYQFSMPEQQVKQVAIPGMTYRCAFQEKKPGVYPLVGDQFCGYTHPNLIGKLIVQDPAEFAEWLNKHTPEKEQ